MRMHIRNSAECRHEIRFFKKEPMKKRPDEGNDSVFEASCFYLYLVFLKFSDYILLIVLKKNRLKIVSKNYQLPKSKLMIKNMLSLV